MKKFILPVMGLVILVGIVGCLVKQDGAHTADLDSLYVVKLSPSAVAKENEKAFCEAIHKADRRSEMRFKRKVDDTENCLPDDPHDDLSCDNGIGKPCDHSAKPPDWGAQVTQRAGFKTLKELKEMIALLTPTPAPPENGNTGY